MGCMSLAVRVFVAALAFVVLSGCSTHRLAERTRLPRHPIHETRMTNQPTAGYVATGVWRVRGASNTVYLAGTRHIVADEEIPFPSAYYAAYRDSQEVLVEVDPLSVSWGWLMMSGVPSAMGFMLREASELKCPKGKTLEDYISPETARQLREELGEDYEAQRSFTPLGLAFFADLNGEVDGEAGVEDLFILLAHRDGKRIRSLDTRKAAQLAGPTLDAMLKEAREEIEKHGADAVLKRVFLEPNEEEKELEWRYGDFATIAKKLAEMKRDHPELYEQLIPERNGDWMPALTRALVGKRNVLVLVGAGHLPGEHGLIELLQKAGYKPEQMYGIDRPDVETADPASAVVRP